MSTLIYNPIEARSNITHQSVINYESDQSEKLRMHYPLIQSTNVITNIWHDSVSRSSGFLFNANANFAYARHPDFGFYVPSFPGTGAGNNATCIAIGRVGGAASESNYNSTTRPFYNPATMSFSVWIRASSIPSSAVYQILGNNTATYSAPYSNWMLRFHCVSSLARIIFDISNGSGGSDTNANSAFGSILAGVDYFLTWTFDGLNLKAYINAVQVDTVTRSGGIGNNASSMYIGGNPQDLFSNDTFGGWIWDFRIYEGALEPSRIVEMYEKALELWTLPKRRPVTYGVSSVIINEAVSHTATVAQVIGTTKTCTRALSNSVTVAQAISIRSNILKSVTSSLTVTQRVNTQFFKALTNTVTVGQTIGESVGQAYFKLVEHFLAVSQSITKRRNAFSSVSHTVTVTQVETLASTHVTHTVTVSHSIKVLRALNLRVSQTVIVGQNVFVQSPQLQTITQNVTVSQTISGRNAVNRQAITHTVFVVDQVAGRNAVFHQAVTQNVTVGHTIFRRDVIVIQSITHAVTVTQRVNTQWFKSVVHDLNIAQIVQGQRQVTRNIVTDIGLTSTFTKSREPQHNLTDMMTIGNVINRQITYNRNIVSTMQVQNIYTPILLVHRPTSRPPIYPPGYTEPTPIVRVFPTGLQIIYDDVCILQGLTSLVLPVPELGDLDSLDQILKLNRSVTGRTLTYVQTSNRQTFGLEFIVDLKKYIEIRDWIFVNNTETVRFTLWNGQIWSVNLTTEPVEFTGVSRTNVNSRELYKVRLEFEGVKTYG